MPLQRIIAGGAQKIAMTAWSAADARAVRDLAMLREIASPDGIALSYDAAALLFGVVSREGGRHRLKRLEARGLLLCVRRGWGGRPSIWRIADAGEALLARRERK